MGRGGGNLEWDGLPSMHAPHIYNVSRCVAQVVIKEDLERALVLGVKEEKLASMRAFIAALPEGVVISYGKSPTMHPWLLSFEDSAQ